MNREQGASPREWPPANGFTRSIRFELSLFVAGMILILMVVSGYLITGKSVRAATAHVVRELLVQARTHSQNAGSHLIGAENPDALMLNGICNRLAADNTDVYWVGISGLDGSYVAHSNLSQVITGAAAPLLGGRQFESMLADAEAFELRADTIYVSIPIREERLNLGRLTLAAAADRISAARLSAIKSVGAITVASILLGLPLTLLVTRRRLRPITLIADTLKQVEIDRLTFTIPIESKNELGYLAQTLEVMGCRLDQARRDSLERQRMSQELAIARDLQAAMLPRAQPRTANFETACKYESAFEVGGDYFDFIEFDDRQLGVIVADVSGKSLPAMLVMLLVREIVKRATFFARQPAAVLVNANRELRRDLKEGMFVTLFFGLLDKKNGHFEFASAGHTAAIYLKEPTGVAEVNKTKGFPLGLVPPEVFDERLETGVLELGRGDSMFLYTDGVTEAKNPAGQQFGIQRLLRLLERNSSHQAQELLDAVHAELLAFVNSAPQYDDLTMLVLKWTGLGQKDAASAPGLESGNAR